MPVYDSLFDYTRGEKKCFDHILVRHEQGATHAAEGYARVSGEVGVALVTSGPGATNTLTGVADAMMDSTPIVVIAGQVAIGTLGTDALGGRPRGCGTAYLQMGIPDTPCRRHCMGCQPCFLYRTKRQTGSCGARLPS